MVQALAGDQGFTHGQGLGESHIAAENQLIGISQKVAELGLSFPVAAFRVKAKARFGQGDRAAGRVVDQTGPADLQLEAPIVGEKPGRKILQAVIEARIGQAWKHDCAALTRPEPACGEGEHQRQASHEHQAPAHTNPPCQLSRCP